MIIKVVILVIIVIGVVMDLMLVYILSSMMYKPAVEMAMACGKI